MQVFQTLKTEEQEDMVTSLKLNRPPPMSINLTVGSIDKKEVLFVGPELDQIQIPKAILPDWLQGG